MPGRFRFRAGDEDGTRLPHLNGRVDPPGSTSEPLHRPDSSRRPEIDLVRRVVEKFANGQVAYALYPQIEKPPDLDLSQLP